MTEEIANLIATIEKFGGTSQHPIAVAAEEALPKLRELGASQPLPLKPVLVAIQKFSFSRERYIRSWWRWDKTIGYFRFGNERYSEYLHSSGDAPESEEDEITECRSIWRATGMLTEKRGHPITMVERRNVE